MQLERFKDLILSVYLYNEWRGYTQLENELIPYLEKSGQVDASLLTSIRKHAGDEKKHYLMFKSYFLGTGRMPFQVSKSVGYFDFLSHLVIGNMEKALEGASGFARICRAILVTEARGLTQIGDVLTWSSFQKDERLSSIFKVIEKDEPSHFKPYEEWLKRKALKGPGLFYRGADLFAHYFIGLVIIPLHFLNFRLKRLERFPDE